MYAPRTPYRPYYPYLDASGVCVSAQRPAAARTNVDVSRARACRPEPGSFGLWTGDLRPSNVILGLRRKRAQLQSLQAAACKL